MRSQRLCARQFLQAEASACGHEFRKCADRYGLREDVVVTRGTEGFTREECKIGIDIAVARVSLYLSFGAGTSCSSSNRCGWQRT